jgi:hypothetical protein
MRNKALGHLFDMVLANENSGPFVLGQELSTYLIDEGKWNSFGLLRTQLYDVVTKVVFLLLGYLSSLK